MIILSFLLFACSSEATKKFFLFFFSIILYTSQEFIFATAKYIQVPEMMNKQTFWIVIFNHNII